MKTVLCLLALVTVTNACGRYDTTTGELQIYSKKQIFAEVCKVSQETACIDPEASSEQKSN